MAAGKHIDEEKVPRFWDQVDQVYGKDEPQKEMSAAEIKEHLKDRIRRMLNGG